MSLDPAIKIEPHICSECFRCVRACGVKAIGITSRQASIRQSECIRCGDCLESCPHDVIKLRDDVEMTRRIIKHSDTIIASIHWSWVTEFPNIEAHRMVEALKLLGFTQVSETLLGKERYDRAVAEQMQRNPRLALSVECPAVVRMVEYYFPNHVSRLLPIAPAEVLHARMLRNKWGSQARIVYITPCIAAKNNIDELSELDAVITFAELRRWMYDDGVEFDFIPGNESYRYEPHDAVYVPNTLIDQAADRVGCDGESRVVDMLNSLSCYSENQHPIYLEMLLCDGGCINGYGMSGESMRIVRELMLKEYYKSIEKRVAGYSFPFIVTRKSYTPRPAEGLDVAESQIEEALRSIAKFRLADHHNCNACGYNTCRDFARALVIGKTNRNMCISYSRSIAKRKFTALIEKMPSGVMLVDENLKIIEANKNIAQIFGSDATLIYETNPGLKRADLKKLLSDCTPFLRVLSSGDDIADQDITIGGKMLKISIFSVEPHKILCALISNMLSGDVKDDEIARRIRQVVTDNLETVQKIAVLLGENASRTEAVLNSIVESAHVGE